MGKIAIKTKNGLFESLDGIMDCHFFWAFKHARLGNTTYFREFIIHKDHLALNQINAPNI